MHMCSLHYSPIKYVQFYLHLYRTRLYEYRFIIGSLIHSVDNVYYLCVCFTNQSFVLLILWTVAWGIGLKAALSTCKPPWISHSHTPTRLKLMVYLCRTTMYRVFVCMSFMGQLLDYLTIGARCRLNLGEPIGNCELTCGNSDFYSLPSISSKDKSLSLHVSVVP